MNPEEIERLGKRYDRLRCIDCKKWSCQDSEWNNCEFCNSSLLILQSYCPLDELKINHVGEIEYDEDDEE